MKIPFIRRRQDTVIISNKRKPLYLLVGILSFFGLIYIIFVVPPTYQVSLKPLNFSVIYLTFLLLCLGVFAIVTYVSKSAKHGMLATLFILAFFWMRLNKFLHPMFTILLVALFLTIELLLTAKKE